MTDTYKTLPNEKMNFSFQAFLLSIQDSLHGILLTNNYVVGYFSSSVILAPSWISKFLEKKMDTETL